MSTSSAFSEKKYDVPAEIRMEIFKHLVSLQPISAKGGSSKQARAGWMTLTHVTKAWRGSCLRETDVWAENVCAYPRIDAINTFLERARGAKLLIDLDRLLLGCYWTKDSEPVNWLLRSNGAVLKTAKTILSSLLVSLNMGAPFNALQTRLGPQTWPELFDIGVYGNLTKLVYHMTRDDDVPKVVQSRIEHLEIFSATTRTIDEDVDDDSCFHTLFYHSQAWESSPTFSTESLIQRLNYHKRARVIRIHGININDPIPLPQLHPITLPQLEELTLKGPDAHELLRINNLISSTRQRRLTLVSNSRNEVAPADALRYAGVIDQPGLTMTVETGYDVRWATLSPHDALPAPINNFSDGKQLAYLTSDYSGAATLHVRAGAISRKTTAENEDHDPFMGVPPANISHLVIKPLTRTHRGERVWHLKARDMEFVHGLSALRSVMIEDERLAVLVCEKLASTAVSRIDVVIRREWKGKCDLFPLAVAARGAASKSETGDIVVCIRGAKRFLDDRAVEKLRAEKGFTFKDERQVMEGVDAEKKTGALEAELQKCRIRVEQSKAEINVLAAARAAMPWE